jgi:hypothetical protein
LGSEVIVSTNVLNQGPNIATGLTVSVVGIPFQRFPFEIVGSETPGCTVDFLDFDPVVLNFYWQAGTLDPNAQMTCVVRLRVRAIPALTGLLTASVRASTTDSNLSNNQVSLPFSFGTPTGPRTVPTGSRHALTVLAVLMLILALTKRSVRVA